MCSRAESARARCRKHAPPEHVALHFLEVRNSDAHAFAALEPPPVRRAFIVLSRCDPPLLALAALGALGGAVAVVVAAAAAALAVRAGRSLVAISLGVNEESNLWVVRPG